MATNRVQFQRGLSMAEFLEHYGSEDGCEEALIASRWPQGFACPVCGGPASCSFRREGRLYWQCASCRHQCSVISGTIFDYLSYCTPSYVIEYQGPAGPWIELADLARLEWREVRRGRPGGWSMVLGGRLALREGPSGESGVARSSARRAARWQLRRQSTQHVPGARPHGTLRCRDYFGLSRLARQSTCVPAPCGAQAG